MVMSLNILLSRPRCRCCAIKQVRRQSEATMAPFVATGDVQSGVALRLPPHSKNSANGPYPTRGHSATAPFIREEQSPLLNKLFRQRHLIYDQVAAFFNVMDFNPQILA